MRWFVVEEPIFKTATLFVVDCSHAELTRYLDTHWNCRTGEDCGQIGQMFTFGEHPPHRVVWARRLYLPVVLHEVFHLVTRICADKGISISAHTDHGMNNDEPAAYLFEFFAKKILNQSRIRWRLK